MWQLPPRASFQTAMQTSTAGSTRCLPSTVAGGSARATASMQTLPWGAHQRCMTSTESSAYYAGVCKWHWCIVCIGVMSAPCRDANQWHAVSLCLVQHQTTLRMAVLRNCHAGLYFIGKDMFSKFVLHCAVIYLVVAALSQCVCSDCHWHLAGMVSHSWSSTCLQGSALCMHSTCCMC